MIRKIFLVSILVMSLVNSKAQTVFISDTGEVTFYSYAPVEDIKATSNKVNSMINFVSGEIAFMIPMRSFRFEKALMQEHFNEKYMESEKFPHATFKGTINEKIDLSKNGAIPVSAKGKLSIHGIEKEIIQKGVLEIGSEKVSFVTEMDVSLADYNIKVPQLLFNNIADTINVKLKAEYVPYKKK